MSGDKKLCFVIMPFSKTTDEHNTEYWTKHFEEFLKPLIEGNPNLKAERSEELRGSILDQIVKNLVTARIVVADLTDYNSNVFWELGIRQSFKHGTVTIAQEGTKLPFDLADKGTLFYSPKTYRNDFEFTKKFKAALEDCLENPERPDSQVLTSIGGRGSIFQLFMREEAIRRLTVVLAECDTNLEVLKDINRTIEGNRDEATNNRLKRLVSSIMNILKKSDEESDEVFPQISTRRFRTCAVERLIVDRYIDESDVFYQLANGYHVLLNELNSQLPSWENDLENFEDWFLSADEFKEMPHTINEFKSKVESARDKLEKSS